MDKDKSDDAKSSQDGEQHQQDQEEESRLAQETTTSAAPLNCTTPQTQPTTSGTASTSMIEGGNGTTSGTVTRNSLPTPIFPDMSHMTQEDNVALVKQLLMRQFGGSGSTTGRVVGNCLPTQIFADLSHMTKPEQIGYYALQHMLKDWAGSGPTTTAASNSSVHTETPDFSRMTEEEQIAYTLQISMRDSKADEKLQVDPPEGSCFPLAPEAAARKDQEEGSGLAQKSTASATPPNCTTPQTEPITPGTTSASKTEVSLDRAMQLEEYMVNRLDIHCIQQMQAGKRHAQQEDNEENLDDIHDVNEVSGSGVNALKKTKISMERGGSGTSAAPVASSNVPTETFPDFSFMTEEEQIAYAMQLSVQSCGSSVIVKDQEEECRLAQGSTTNTAPPNRATQVQPTTAGGRGTATAVPTGIIPDFSFMTDEERIAYTLRISMEEFEPKEKPMDVDPPKNVSFPSATSAAPDMRLISAVSMGDAAAVQRFLASGANPHFTWPMVDGIRVSLLTLAALEDHLEIVKILNDAGLSLEGPEGNHPTALHWAAFEGHFEMLRYLLQKGVNQETRDKRGKTALHLAAGNGHAACVYQLLQSGADVNANNVDGWTPLHYAADDGRVDAVKELLKAHVNINAKNNLGLTPLHRASQNGHVSTVKALAEARADINVKSNDGVTPLHYAARTGYNSVVKELLKADANIHDKTSDGETPLNFAAFGGYVDIVKVLLAAGANISDTNHSGMTPLHYAADTGHANVIEVLLKAGANINAKTRDGEEALAYAAMSGHIDAVNMLIAAGANKRNRDKQNWTAQRCAAASGSREVMKALADNLSSDTMQVDGDLTNVADRLGHADTSWWLRKRRGSLSNPASSEENLEEGVNMIDMYLTFVKIDINAGRGESFTKSIPQSFDGHAQDVNGMTALHWAATFGDPHLVKGLLKYSGLYPFSMTYKGETPADLAQKQGHNNVVLVFTALASPKIEGTKEDLYEKLLELISGSDDVKGARDLIWAGAPVTPVGSFATEALTLAMDWNRPRIVSLLVAAGAPLTSTTGGLSLLNKTLRNPDITSYVKAFILRAYFNQLGYEYQNVRDHKELSKGMGEISTMLKNAIANPKLTQVQWPSSDTKHLSKLLTEATRRNCPLVCSLLYQAGGKTFLSSSDNPVRAAIENQHWKMLKALVCNMGASPYVCDSKLGLPLLKMPLHVRQDIEQVIYEKERRKLEVLYERRKDEEKQMVSKVMILQENLFNHYRSGHDTGIHATTRSFATSANTNITDPFEINKAALLIALKRGLPQLIFLVVKVGGINVDTVVDSPTGTTSLHQAASLGRGVCAVLLLGLGADPSRPDHYRQSAMHLAAMFGHQDVYHCLLQYNKHKNYSCRAGKTPEDVCSGFENYLKLYEKCGQRSVENEELNLCADSTEATEKLLNCLKWEQLRYETDRIKVDFTKGEAKDAKDTVIKELRKICDNVEEIDKTFKGKLKLGGSSSDGTKLYAPDEVDVNVVLDNNFEFSIEVVDQEDKELFNSGFTKVFEIKTNSPHLQGNKLLTKFYDLVQKYLEENRLVDERLSLVPPGISMTQVGAALHFAWQGEEYPLLLIGVDLVPVVEVPWIEGLSRPFLTPPDRKTFHISNTSDGLWRGSFAGTEAEVLRQLNFQELLVYLLCKILLSCMKPEPWMSSKKKSLYSWWSAKEWRISMPSTFALKNAFFRCLERKRKCGMEWPEEKLLEWVSNVFGEMCRNYSPTASNLECREHTKIRPYFAEEFQQPKNGAGAPEIVRYLGKRKMDDGK